MSQANQRRVLAELDGVFTFTVSNVKQFCLQKSLESTEKLSRSTIVYPVKQNLGSVLVGRRTSDRKIASSTPGRCIAA